MLRLVFALALAALSFGAPVPQSQSADLAPDGPPTGDGNHWECKNLPELCPPSP